MKVGFISLGCNKNLVDTEKTIAIFNEEGFEIVNKPENADIIVINTCGFIESAKEEAINTILEMAEYKKKRCRYLIVMGCLVERYKEDLEKTIFTVNKEATIEITKQIRLRDIGGIIIIDYIDMENKEDKAKILEILEEKEKDENDRL